MRELQTDGPLVNTKHAGEVDVCLMGLGGSLV
jgi:hypothetical protein